MKIPLNFFTILTKEDIIRIGFVPIPHFTVCDSHVFKLGCNTHLSIGSIGTPNEMLFICSTDYEDDQKITDVIILHNYDYDGFLSEEKLRSIIDALIRIKK